MFENVHPVSVYSPIRSVQNYSQKDQISCHIPGNQVGKIKKLKNLSNHKSYKKLQKTKKFNQNRIQIFHFIIYFLS